jgi:hypothetical protein
VTAKGLKARGDLGVPGVFNARLTASRFTERFALAI